MFLNYSLIHLIVSGPEGCGKSRFIKDVLLPALARSGTSCAVQAVLDDTRASDGVDFTQIALFVSGPQGCGKSHFVEHVLLPALARGGIASSVEEEGVYIKRGGRRALRIIVTNELPAWVRKRARGEG
jgi:pantothenate kinase-related protein Tda10